MFFKDFTKALIATGVYFLTGTFHVFSLTSGIVTDVYRIGSIETLPINGLCLSLFFLYLVLNFVTMIHLHLDYKEMKNSTKK